MAPVTRQSLIMAAGVPIFHPLVRQTGQQLVINSHSSTTHHGETEPARPSSPEAASHKEGGLRASGKHSSLPLFPRSRWLG